MLRLRYILISLAILNQILCFGKLNEGRSLEDNKIDELEINKKFKVEIKRNKFSYFYLKTTDMNENANFGSILFEGIKNINDIKIKGINLHYDYIDNNEFLKKLQNTQTLKTYKLYYDPNYQNYELLFENELPKAKYDTNNFFLFSIEGETDITLDLIALAFPNVEIFEPDKAKERNLIYEPNQIIYHQIKINDSKFRKKTVLIYTENQCHIKFAGNLNDQIKINNAITEKYNLNIFKFDREQTSEIRVTFKFKCDKKYHARVLVESTSKNVALFQENRVRPKIFQTLFSYMQSFDFYYIGNYKEVKNNYELYPVQKLGFFKFYYTTHISNYILQNENEKELLPNKFLQLKNKLIIIYIKPILPGTLDIKIFENLDEINIENNGITNIKIEKDRQRLIRIPNNERKNLYLTIKTFGSSKIECNYQGEKLVITNKPIYKELINEVELTCDSVEDALFELTAIYDSNLYYLVTEKKKEITNLNDRKGIVIQLEKNTNYYSPEIRINVPDGISNFNVEFYVGETFVKSDKYIPLISKGGNPILMTINDDNKEEFLQISQNPYDEKKMPINEDNLYFYILEFKNVKIDRINIAVNYKNKKSQAKDTSRENEKYVLNEKLVQVIDNYDKNFMRIATMKCKNNIKNTIKMKYEEFDLWSETLIRKYNFFQISSIYNGITFELENKKNKILFTYSYSNEYIDLLEFESEFNVFINQNMSIYSKLDNNKLTFKRITIGNYKDKNTKLYLLDVKEYVTNYDDICTLNSVQESDKTKIISLNSDGEYDFGKNEIANGDWYLVVVKEFDNPINFDVIIYSEKVKIENGKIKIDNNIKFNEIKINQKTKIGDKKSYLYLDITKLNGTEGSILFEGIVPDEYIINTVVINIKKDDIVNDELYERFKEGFQVSNTLIKDPNNNYYELFYEKIIDFKDEDRKIILLIEIISNSNMEFFITPLPFPKELVIQEINAEKKYKLKCSDSTHDICYYKMKIKPFTYEYEKKYILLYKTTKESLIYKGHMNPLIAGEVRDEVKENQKHQLLVFDYDYYYENEIAIIFKFYKKEDYEIVIEITNTKVVVFNSINEQVFESIFSYDAYYPFYFVGTYPENLINWAIYNEQSIGNFELSMNTDYTNGILPMENVFKFEPNSLYKIKTNFIIIYVKPTSPGNLKLIFFNLEGNIQMNGLNHVFLEKEKTFKINESPKNVNLHIKLIGKGKVKLNSKHEITNEFFINDKMESIKLTTEKEILLSIIVTENLLYKTIQPTSSILVRNQKNILFEYPNDLRYGSIEIDIKANKEVFYNSYFSHTKSAEFFPSVQLSRNPIRNSFNQLNDYHDTIFFDKNPYDQFHLDINQHKFFYGIELENENLTSLYISFIRNEKDLKYQYESNEKEFNYISNDHFPALAKTNKEKIDIQIMCYFCKRITSNSLVLKYEKNTLLRRTLTSQFNFYELPVLYNGMHFELSNNSDSAILYYQYTDKNEKINQEFINEIYKLNFNPINENYITLEGSKLKLKDHPLKKYKVKLKVFLLKKNIQEFSYNYDNLCYLTKIEVKKKEGKYENNVIIIPFDKEIDLKERKGNWYLIVIGEYNDIIGTRLILFKEKVTISGDKIEIEKIKFKELKPNGEKLKLEDKISYFYIDIRKMGKEKYGKEGSIVLKGLDKEEEGSKISVHMAFDRSENLDEKSFSDSIKSFERKELKLEYDKKNKLVEFYYEKTLDILNYIIIQIENYLDKTNLEVQATDFVIYKEIDEDSLKTINSFNCNKKDLPCYYQYKIKPDSYTSKYLIFYSKSLDRLIYKGSINPSNSYSNKTTIIDENICYFVVLKYQSEQESDIIVTIKFYNEKNELNAVKLLMDYSNLKIVRFIGTQRKEKIFQSIFTYGNEFPFYFLQCYTKEEEKFEMYNEQPSNIFKIYYKNKFEKSILPTESDIEIKSNSFNEVIESDIMLIKPLSAGNLYLRIYPLSFLDEKLINEGRYHMHLPINQERIINLPLVLEKSPSFYISVHSINKGKFSFNDKLDTFDSISEEVNNKVIKLKTSDNLLVVIVIRYKKDLYEVISIKEDDQEIVKVVKDKKLILIEYQRSDNYGKTMLELTNTMDVKYKVCDGFAISDKYFPQVSESKSDISLEFNELNKYIETVQMEINPYHDLRLRYSQNENYKYYYAIEFEENNTIDVKLIYNKRPSKNSNLNENKFKTMNGDQMNIYPRKSEKKYISISAYVCDYSYQSKLFMKYGDDEIIWSGNLENLYNFYKIPLLYKYIYFSQEEINNNILFSYAYNDDSQKDTEFINKIQNYKSSKIEINKSLKISEPLEKFKVSEYYIYLLPKESEYKTQLTNLCYLNNLKEENDIKIISKKEKEINFNSDYNGNYYIAIIADYENPFPIRLPLYFGKISFKNGEIFEEENQFNELKTNSKITEPISNFYINLDKMDVKEKSEGSIIFKGIDENNIKKYKIKIAYLKKNENRNDKIKSNGTDVEFVYDSKNQIYEIYYSKESTDNIELLIQINRQDDESEIELQTSEIVNNIKTTEKDFSSKINNLKCDIDKLCYFRFEFDQNKIDTEYKYFVIYSETYNRLFYKGSSINPRNGLNSIEEIVENNECNIVSLGFKKDEDSKISIIAKLYRNNELRSKAEITNEKVVFFHGTTRKERLFQTFFPYENYFSFYLLECYKIVNSDFEIYPEQNSKEFELVYHTKLDDHIFPTNKDGKLPSNDYTIFNSRYEIIYIKPKGPGDLNLRIYQKDLKYLKKNSLNTIHLKPNIPLSLSISRTEFNNIYLSITKLNSNELLKLNLNEDNINIEAQNYEKQFLPKNDKIRLETKSNMLVSIVINYEFLYHVINIGNAKIKLNSPKKYFLIEYEKNLLYSSSNITISTSKEVSYNMAFGFSKSPQYFPLVSNSGNPLRFRFHKNHLVDNIYSNKNPYDQYKILNDFSYYYALEFDEPVDLNVKFNYSLKNDQNDKVLKENKVGIISKNKINIDRTYNNSHISFFVLKCGNEKEYELKMKYENENLWTNKISKKYNYYNIPILHNGIHFEQSNVNANTLFLYKFHNNKNNENNFIKQIESFKESNDYILINNKNKVSEFSYSKNPLKDIKVTSTKLYLLKQNDKNAEKSQNMCYLNSEESTNDKDLKIINFNKDNTYKFKENDELNGKWYMTIESEYSENVISKFIVYNGKVEIKKGLIVSIESTNKKNSKTVLIIILIILVCIAIVLAIIFIIKRSKDDYMSEFPTQNISLIAGESGKYTKV